MYVVNLISLQKYPSGIVKVVELYLQTIIRLPVMNVPSQFTENFVYRKVDQTMNGNLKNTKQNYVAHQENIFWTG